MSGENENPFQSPQQSEEPTHLRLGEAERERLRRIAIYQKGVIFSILIYVLAFATRLFFFPMPMHHMLGMLIVGVASLVGVVFTILLAVELFGPAGGILLGLLVLFPCLGLIVLLVINSQATAELRRHGIRVGLLGADMSQF